MASLRKILDALLDRYIGEIADAFRSAIQDITDNAIIRDLIAAIEAGDLERAFRAVGYSDAAMRPISAAIEKTFEGFGNAVGSTFPKYLNTPSGRSIFRFDVRSSVAEAYLRDKSSTLITRIGEETRVNVRNVITAGMADGRNPRSVALDITGRLDRATGHRTGGIVGLTNRQEYWVRNVRAKLTKLDNGYFGYKLRDKRFDATVAKAINSNTPLPPDVVDKLVDRYKANTLRYRGETIARTEALQSLNAANFQATQQAIEMGAVKLGGVQKVWDNAGDNRVRHSHVEMEGQTVAFDAPFITPSGSRLMFPLDTSLDAEASEIIDCRCRFRTKIDWLADLD